MLPGLDNTKMFDLEGSQRELHLFRELVVFS